MMEPTDDDVPEHNPLGFIVFAECYGRAAFTVASGQRLPHAAPIATLALHCIELSLKAVLLARGVTGEALKREYGHGLMRLFADSGLDWSDIMAAEEVEFLDGALRSQTLRYRNSRRSYLVEEQHVLPLMEAVFHRCLRFVAPTALRTLRH